MIVSQGDDTVTVVAQPSKAGAGAVTLVADSGAVVTLANAWDYVEPTAIASATPQSGQIGTLVTIAGSNLRAGAERVTVVSLAGREAKIHNESNTQIIVEASLGKLLSRYAR